jgi:hypothetical protein
MPSSNIVCVCKVPLEVEPDYDTTRIRHDVNQGQGRCHGLFP